MRQLGLLKWREYEKLIFIPSIHCWSYEFYSQVPRPDRKAFHMSHIQPVNRGIYTFENIRRRPDNQTKEIKR